MGIGFKAVAMKLSTGEFRFGQLIQSSRDGDHDECRRGKRSSLWFLFQDGSKALWYRGLIPATLLSFSIWSRFGGAPWQGGSGDKTMVDALIPALNVQLCTAGSRFRR